jgi:hypothetical protein
MQGIACLRGARQVISERREVEDGRLLDSRGILPRAYHYCGACTLCSRAERPHVAADIFLKDNWSVSVFIAWQKLGQCQMRCSTPSGTSFTVVCNTLKENPGLGMHTIGKPHCTVLQAAFPQTHAPASGTACHLPFYV